jgi:peptide deformylase
MSLPDRAGNVERRKKLRVSCFDQDGSRQKLLFEGFDARIAAHEVDHLRGKMYCDQVTGPMFDLDFDEVRKRIELRRQAEARGEDVN